jgi:hypothetical protein
MFDGERGGKNHKVNVSVAVSDVVRVRFEISSDGNNSVRNTNDINDRSNRRVGGGANARGINYE